MRLTCLLLVSLSWAWTSRSFAPRQIAVWRAPQQHARVELRLAKDADGSYYPDGMTPEEYREMKKKEADRRSKLDYGMFGPRFQKTERPSDDWLLTPSLWTGGFNANEQNVSQQETTVASSDTETKSSVPVRVWAYCKKYAAAYYLSYSAIDVAFMMRAMLVAAKMSLLARIWMVARMLVWSRTHDVQKTWFKVVAIKTVASILLMYPANRYIEHANRKWLWSKRRTVLTSLAGFLGVATLWAFGLSAIRRIHGPNW